MNAHGIGSIRKRSDGRWEARYTAPDGTQKSVYGKTKQQAVEKLKQKQAEIATGTYLESSRMTVEDWLKLWLESYATQIRDTTKANYARYSQLYFIPALGSVRLDRLKPAHVQKLFNDLSGTLAPGTVNSIRIALSSALSTAERLDFIKANPCRKSSTPKVMQKLGDIIDREMLPAFIEAAKCTNRYTELMVMLQTGIRSAELRGLKWSDIDFANGIMTIQRQMVCNNGYNYTQPKSGKGRNIVLMEDTIELLKRHRIEQAEEKLKKAWKDTEMTADLVFRTSSGNHLLTCGLRGAFDTINEMLGTHLHPHSLRHSYAVAALRSGVDVKTVQNNLGHADAAMTLGVYAQYTIDMGRAAAQKMGEYFRENSRN